MAKNPEQLDAAFIDAQKQRLLRLKSELTTVNRDRDQETSNATQALSGQAREYEEDAQHLSEFELSGQLGESLQRRLGVIDRALAKIAEGTYGESDLSGEPIGVERLKVLPEAIYTLKEQESRDAKSTTTL